MHGPPLCACMRIGRPKYELFLLLAFGTQQWRPSRCTARRPRTGLVRATAMARSTWYPSSRSSRSSSRRGCAILTRSVRPQIRSLSRCRKAIATGLVTSLRSFACAARFRGRARRHRTARAPPRPVPLRVVSQATRAAGRRVAARGSRRLQPRLRLGRHPRRPCTLWRNQQHRRLLLPRRRARPPRRHHHRRRRHRRPLARRSVLTSWRTLPRAAARPPAGAQARAGVARRRVNAAAMATVAAAACKPGGDPSRSRPRPWAAVHTAHTASERRIGRPLGGWLAALGCLRSLGRRRTRHCTRRR